MRKLARLLGSTVVAGDEKAGWAWLKTDEEDIQYLIEHPDPDFDAGGKMDKERMEALYRLAAVAAVFLGGGEAKRKGFGMADQNPEQHRLGVEVEAEHVTDKGRMDIRLMIQGRISRDHEAEDKDEYYFRDKSGEAKVKGEK